MTTLIAHRGLPAHHRENTLVGFAAALEHTAVIELDVRATSDAVLVCAHDATLARTHGIDQAIGQLSWHDLHDRAPDIPLLRDVLAECGSAAGVFVDCKVSRPRVIDALIATVDDVGMAWEQPGHLRGRGLPRPGHCVFEHPDASVVQHVRSRTGGACVELVRSQSKRLELALTAPFICMYADGVVVPDALATRSMLRLLHSLRLGVYVYTINDQVRIDELVEFGVDGIFTDDVRALGCP